MLERFQESKIWSLCNTKSRSATVKNEAKANTVKDWSFSRLIAVRPWLIK